MSDRPDAISKKVRKHISPSVQPTQYRELKQVIFDLMRIMSMATDPSLQYFALRSLISIAISVLDENKHYKLVKQCKEVLAEEIELPSVDLRYEMHPNTPREIYTFQVDNKTIKVSSEVFVPTFQMIEKFLYRKYYVRYASLVIDILKTLIEEEKLPWEMKYTFSLSPISLPETFGESTGNVVIFSERPELGAEEEEVEGEEEWS